MSKVLILILVVLLAFILFKYAAAASSGGFERIIGGRAGTEYAVMLMVKVPIEVRAMQRKYIKHVSMPSHLTLGYLKPLNACRESVFAKLRKVPPIKITFEHLKVVKTFAGLIPSPKDMKKLKHITDIFNSQGYLKHGPRGGYHMSIAYNQHSKPLSKYTLKDIRKNLPPRPFTVQATSIRIIKRKNYGEWQTYKTFPLKGRSTA